MTRPWMRPLLALIFCTSCSLHQVDVNPSAQVCMGKGYPHKSGKVCVDRWWEEFGSDDLNFWVNGALACNFDLKASWMRVAQAYANLGVQSSGKYPSIDQTLNASYSHTDDNTSSGALDGGSTSYLVSHGLSYEIDLFRRIHSLADSACHQLVASRDDMEAFALTLSGTVTEFWLTIAEQRELLELLEEQIETNRTQLGLVELRFSLGQASALDVYQQRQQLAATLAQVPPVQSALEVAYHNLRQLTAKNPQALVPAGYSIKLPQLPPMPRMGKPCDLLCLRPDLRAAKERVVAADYDTAAAVADRLPRLSLSLDYDLVAAGMGQLFEQQIASVAGNLLTPLVDGGRRRAEVERKKAITCERLYAYSNSVLIALREVEDALSQEKYQIELIHRLENQLEFATINLREAKSRYSNGLDDYLTVIAAIQTKQALERRLITEHHNLLSFRSLLYRSLGGRWTRKLKPCGLT